MSTLSRNLHDLAKLEGVSEMSGSRAKYLKRLAIGLAREPKDVQGIYKELKTAWKEAR